MLGSEYDEVGLYKDMLGSEKDEVGLTWNALTGK